MPRRATFGAITAGSSAASLPNRSGTIVPGPLSRIQDAPLAGPGHASTAARGPAGTRTRCCHTARWRSSPPVPAARSLNFVGLHPGPWRGQAHLDLGLLEDRAAVLSPAADPGRRRRGKTRPPQSRSRLAACLPAMIGSRRGGDSAACAVCRKRSHTQGGRLPVNRSLNPNLLSARPTSVFPLSEAEAPFRTRSGSVCAEYRVGSPGPDGSVHDSVRNCRRHH
jgi:hypothetical protein